MVLYCVLLWHPYHTTHVTALARACECWNCSQLQYIKAAAMLWNRTVCFWNCERSLEPQASSIFRWMLWVNLYVWQVSSLSASHEEQRKMKNFVAFLCVCCVALTLVHSYPQSFADSNRIDDEDDIIDLSPVGPKIFGEPDSATGLLVAQYNPQTDDINPEELGNYAEGDMLMPRGFARNGLTAQSSRWPNGQVPFEIRGNFGKFNFSVCHDDAQLRHFHTHRCLPNEYDWTSDSRISSQNVYSVCAANNSTRLRFDCEWQHRMLVERWSHWRKARSQSTSARLSCQSWNCHSWIDARMRLHARTESFWSRWLHHNQLEQY